MAFAGRPISPDPDRVVWAGIVSEKLTFAQYWADGRFKGKKTDATALADNIYAPGPDGSLVQVPNPVHGEHETAKDCGGEFVLVLDPAWHLKPEMGRLPDPYTRLHLPRSSRRGHRARSLEPSDRAELIAFFASGAQPHPKFPPSGRSCGKAPARQGRVRVVRRTGRLGAPPLVPFAPSPASLRHHASYMAAHVAQRSAQGLRPSTHSPTSSSV
jgi:hypothetical protein